MNAFVEQEWCDPRLIFYEMITDEYFELDSRFMVKVWVPDLYFTNEKRANFHSVTVPNKMLHLYNNGCIRYRLRYFSQIDKIIINQNLKDFSLNVHRESASNVFWVCYCDTLTRNHTYLAQKSQILTKYISVVFETTSSNGLYVQLSQ